MKVKLFTILKQLAGTGELEVALEDGDTVGKVLTRLAADYPALRQHLFDRDGKVEGYINIFVNGRSIRFLDGLDTRLSEDDVLALFPPVAGG